MHYSFLRMLKIVKDVINCYNISDINFCQINNAMHERIYDSQNTTEN